MGFIMASDIVWFPHMSVLQELWAGCAQPYQLPGGALRPIGVLWNIQSQLRPWRGG